MIIKQKIDAVGSVLVSEQRSREVPLYTYYCGEHDWNEHWKLFWYKTWQRKKKKKKNNSKQQNYLISNQVEESVLKGRKVELKGGN